jgi:hypothetical protein
MIDLSMKSSDDDQARRPLGLDGVLVDTGEFHFQAWWRTGLKVIIEP